MAEQKLLQLNITAVDGPVFSGEVVSVTVPGSEGEMTLLANHTPIISALKRGTIQVRLTDGETKEYPIESGTLEVSKNNFTILI